MNSLSFESANCCLIVFLNSFGDSFVASGIRQGYCSSSTEPAGMLLLLYLAARLRLRFLPPATRQCNVYGDAHIALFLRSQKIPTKIKIKLALPPPLFHPPPPPLKTRNFMGMGFFSSTKNRKITGTHKIGADISGPRVAAEKLRI